jgi:hypothetical protein
MTDFAGGDARSNKSAKDRRTVEASLIVNDCNWGDSCASVRPAEAGPPTVRNLAHRRDA